ncbi:MAG: CapA family protein [Clostridia bacterium]|nr:CapA family protein [Clostridia bacterium]
MKKRTRRQKAIIKRNIFLSLCAVVLIGAIALIGFIVSSVAKPDNNKSNTSNNQSTQSKVEPKPVPDTYATVLSIGDIMAHQTQIDGAKTSDGYDFSAFFKEVSPYFKDADLTIGNLELTFGGTESGKYRGYPSFNTPDQLADVIKSSGIGMLMTSNNHSYDTSFFGLKRTTQILKEKGIEYTGTKGTLEEPAYLVKDVNGIKIGIANFTYETPGDDANRKYLNGGAISAEANDYINTFSYQRIDKFYTEAQSIIDSMRRDGAEFITFYMHWGEEYQLTANNWQKSIAQELCNLGVDIIIGGHPHVVQPMELIHSEDSQNTAVCIYSLGNAVSNQRRELISNSRQGHTEDGVMFSYTLKKSKGEVTLQSIDLIPTWVHKYQNNGYKYTIYPIEDVENISSKYPDYASKLKESYSRTKAIVGKGLTDCQENIGCEITFK